MRANTPFLSLKRSRLYGFLALVTVSIVFSVLQSQELRLHAAGSNTDGNIYWNGQGLYDACTPWGSNDYNGCFGRLDKMASGGFTLVVNYNQMWGDAAGEIAYLNHAQADGMKVIFAINDSTFWNGTNLLTYYTGLAATCKRPDNTSCQINTDFITYVINLVKNHPALWGYYVADEVSSTNHTVLKTFTDLVHQLDPDHPRLLVEGSEGPNLNPNLQTLADTANVLAQDYYPVGSTADGDTVAATGSLAAEVQGVANQYGKQSGMVLQAMSWDEYSGEGWRCTPPGPPCGYPTEADQQNMLNLLLQNSQPRIVLWYSYFDILRSDNPTQHWNNLVTAINSITSSMPTPTLASAPTLTPPPTSIPTPTSTPIPTATPTPAGSRLSIYDDAVASGWSNWSWHAQTNFANTKYVYSGTKSISFATTAGYGGIYLHTYTNIDTTPYTYFSFAARATTTNQRYEAVLYDTSDNALRVVPLANYGGNPAKGSWKVYNIPLTALGALRKPIHGVSIQDMSGKVEHTLYLDAIELH